MIAFLLLAWTGQEPLTITDHVDSIEHSYYYDDDGKLIFDQWIFWRDEEVLDWRLVKPPYIETPTSLRFWDGELHRKVVGRVWRSDTQYDVDLEERKILPADKRVKLTPQRRASKRVGK